MILCFELSMPSNNAWNGKWSGEKKFYAKVVNMGRSKKAAKRVKDIIDNGNYYYNFGDGWTACISVKEINWYDAREVRQKTAGFCGYDWMIDDIILHGEIKG